MKKLELLITKAWQEQSAFLNTLAPLSWLYGGVGSIKKSLHQQGVLNTYRAKVPVLVIGNITVGGSGKTPLIIALVKYLQSINVSVGVISRGYGGRATMPCLVDVTSTPEQVGDEPCLIVQETMKAGQGVPMAVGANRKETIELLLANYPQIEMILSDDGLQHYALYRDEEWIVVDALRGFGNGKLFPQGFLREPIDRLEQSVVVYHDINTAKYTDTQLTMYLAVQSLEPLVNHYQPDPNSTEKAYAISGIGYPDRFFQTVRSLGFDPICQAFGDHHQFVLEDLLVFADAPILVTSKDAVKLRQLAKNTPHQIFSQIWVVSVQAVLSKAVYEQMNIFINRYVRPTNFE